MPQRWVVVADTGFLPARRGGEREHLGFVRAARDAGLLALLVVPDSRRLDRAAYAHLTGGAPVLRTPRRDTPCLAPLLLLHPRDPYVVASRPAPPRLAKVVAALAPDATGVVVFSHKARGIGDALGRALGLPVVVRQHNREGAYHRDLARDTAGPRRLALRWEARRIERDERRLGHRPWVAGQADISAADARWRAGHGGAPVVHVPPFAEPATPVTDHPLPAGERVVFVGALDIATNVAAVEWLLARVWPRVAAARPRAALDLVGRSPAAADAARLAGLVAAAPRAALHTDVPDVAPYLARARVAVNPAVTGSGVNIKVVDYLRAGLPVVSTSRALDGLDLRPGTDLLVADDPAACAAALVRVLTDDALAARVGAAGQGRAAELLDPAAGLAAVERLLAAGGRPHRSRYSAAARGFWLRLHSPEPRSVPASLK